MKKIAPLIIFLCLTWQIAGHPWKPSHYIVIDTDCGIDDMRAISMLLASPDVRVLAITVSGGAVDPGAAYLKIRSLLDHYHHQGIPVGINRALKGANLPLPSAYKWGDEPDIEVPVSDNFVEVITGVLDHESTNISFISLGSLNTIYRFLGYAPGYGSRISRIIWSNGTLNRAEGFNYEIDARSANAIIHGDIRLNVVGPPSDYQLYSGDMVNRLNEINTRYARAICSSFSNTDDDQHEFLLIGADDLVPLFLHYPALFFTDAIGIHSFSIPGEPDGIRSSLEIILNGETVNQNQVIKSFPVDTSFYMADVQLFMNDIIDRHGLPEWNSGILANELHRHLGVYSIIGVKMGILAREYFHIGVDEMTVVSRAGSTPPLSCMNDGLQVSTGATPGHGLLRVIDENCRPAAEFTYHDRKITVTLKDEISDLIAGHLKEINFVYGLDSNIYWELVREKALLHWKNLSRYDIFDLTETE